MMTVHFRIVMGLLAIATMVPYATALGPGDCMIVAINGDSADAYGVLLLAPLPAGAELTVTDDMWSTSKGTFEDVPTYDAHVVYTAAEEQPAGQYSASALLLAEACYPLCHDASRDPGSRCVRARQARC